MLKKTTVTIIIINIIFFIVFNILFPTLRQEIIFYLNSNFNVFKRLAWYFFSAFTHTSIFHLGFNMLFLFYFGPVLENTLKEKAYLLYYIIIIILSGIIYDFLSSTIAVGASGVLYAMMGTVLVWRLKNFLITYISVESIYYILGVNILFSIIGSNISIVGHLSGFAAGVIYALIYRAIYLDREQKKMQKFDSNYPYGS